MQQPPGFASWQVTVTLLTKASDASLKFPADESCGLCGAPGVCCTAAPRRLTTGSRRACRFVGQRGGTTGGLLRASSHRTLTELCPETPRHDPATASRSGPVSGATRATHDTSLPQALPLRLALNLSRARSLSLEAQHHFSCSSTLLSQHKLWHCPALPRLAQSRPTPTF